MRRPMTGVAMAVWVGVAWLVTMAINVLVATAQLPDPPAPVVPQQVPLDPGEHGGECSRP